MKLPRDRWIAGLLTLVRVPLAAAFPFVIGKTFAAVAILALAGLSDVLDGWYARRTGQATAAGALLDPVVDKLFVATVLLTLLFNDRLSLHLALLVGSRDLLELPLVVWALLEPKRLSERTGQVKANALGKAVTFLQFATILAALVVGQCVQLLALASAISGAVAAGSYWSRVLRNRRASPGVHGGPEEPLELMSGTPKRRRLS